MGNSEAQSSNSASFNLSRVLRYSAIGFALTSSVFRICDSLQHAAIYDGSNSFMAEPSAFPAPHDDESAQIIESSTESNISIGATYKSSSNKSSTNNSSGSSPSGGVVLVLEQEPLSFDKNMSSVLQVSRFSSKPECTPLLPNEVSMTLTTQLSLDRMWIMKYQCERWPDPQPISIAVYLPHDDKRNETFVTDELKRLGCDLSCMTVTILKERKGTLRDYPVNHLRNLALEGVQTTHAAYIDSDFMVSRGLYESLMQTAAVVATNSSPVAIVMPAFEYYSSCSTDLEKRTLEACLDTEALPETREDVLSLLNRTKEQRPRVLRGYQSFDGSNQYHGSTRYVDWTNHTITEPVKIPCIRKTVYEPYLAVRMCRDLPRFPEVFTGWGFNKVVWIRMLWRKLGYELWQIPRDFVIHIPHPLSNATRMGSYARPPAVDRWMQWFTKELPDHENRLPDCKTYKKRRKEQEQKARKADGS